MPATTQAVGVIPQDDGRTQRSKPKRERKPRKPRTPKVETPKKTRRKWSSWLDHAQVDERDDGEGGAS